MFKKFIHGFIFGLGFILAFLLVGWISETYQSFSLGAGKLSLLSEDNISYEEKAKWRDLPVSKKIPKLSGMVLLRFKREENHFMSAYVKSVFTKNNAVKMPLNVGDRVEESDYYANTNGRSGNRDGILLMYVDDPPKEIEGAYLYGSRLVANGNIPLELFLKKFEDANKD